ncbi:Spindle assembly checkpoint component Mad1 domain-containing protein [Rozella allomycis CSF55]|uniref:Spindle assembly checkpoint component MAD1 n=1 Tax=Rozella allomycis (strain CSF55) TaxID=988480 RepID=A0A075AZH0_ROZAC|nr:Spindle assembly checkpoint component Mad1 domain-containing protein [Rozella allomycis CSF55]|eukprot:EPZ33984.1 Spindle assembly checkpoint component Mad1 domain-containing protein [Rozella allomycis CSF55]
MKRTHSPGKGFQTPSIVKKIHSDFERFISDTPTVSSTPTRRLLFQSPDDESKRKMREYETEKVTLENKIKILEKTINDKNNVIKELGKDRSLLICNNDDNESKIKQLSDIIEKREKESIEIERNLNSQISALKDEMVEKSESLEGKIRVLEKMLSKEKEISKEFEEKCNELQTNLLVQSKQNELLKAQQNEKRKSFVIENPVDKQFESKEYEILRKSLEYTKEIESLKKRLEESQKVQTVYQDLQNENQILKEKVFSFENQMKFNKQIQSKLLETEVELESTKKLLEDKNMNKKEDSELLGSLNEIQLRLIEETDKNGSLLVRESYEHEIENQKDLQTLKAQNEELKLENTKLKNERNNAESSLALMENKIGAGDYDPLKTRILHLKENPEFKAYSHMRNQLNLLRTENERLLSKDSNPTMSVPEESLKRLEEEIKSLSQKLNDAETRNLRLKQVFISPVATKVFKDKITEFREIVYSLFGYKLDFTNSIQLLSMYAFNEDDVIKFNRNSDGTLTLVETPFISSYKQEINMYLNRQKIENVVLKNPPYQCISEEQKAELLAEFKTREKWLLEMIQTPATVQGKKIVSSSLSEGIKKRKGSISKPLLDTNGSDFVFSGRDRSFEVFLECTRKRYDAWVQKKTDQKLHPLPFLADGPGSGKSRYVQELSVSFKCYVEQSNSSDDFKKTIKEALFININFGNDTTYSDEDVEIGIEKAICLRVLQQVDPINGRAFVMQYDSKQETEKLLAYTIRKVCGDYKCLVLGIDEINKIYCMNENEFKKLFTIVGEMSCSSTVFFVPVLAGTVIGPVMNTISNSMHPPCHIPLPLLTLESCKNILKTKLPELDVTDARFLQLVSDIGGHCRSLEYLYDALIECSASLTDYWDNVGFKVRQRVKKTYAVSNPALGRAIAYSFLSIPIGEHDIVFKETKFIDLEEAGLIKLETKGEVFIVRIPFVFVWCHMQQYYDNKYYKLWTNLLIGRDIGWQDWETFNQYYIAFRLSLYAFLEKTTVLLTEFFNGAVNNFPEDTIGVSVKKTLFALQMKFSDSKRPFNDDLVKEEYKNVYDSVTEYLETSDFISIMLCRKDGEFSENELPENSAVVANSELLAYFGDSYYQRLKKE